MKRNKIAVFADKLVGKSTIEFLLANYPDDIEVIACVNEDSVIYKDLLQSNLGFSKKVIFDKDLNETETIDLLRERNLDYIILAWWPKIIKEPILSIPKIGILNFHPSLLPYNRGKNYNFWSIVEESPFGVSIHFVNKAIDGGDIIFQHKIEKSWEDTGATLFEKAQYEMLKLFKSNYGKIRDGEYTPIKQLPGTGSFHLSKELNSASFIELDKTYTAKELLNIIRARTFPPHPAAWFESDGVKYEVRIEITKINNLKS